MGSHFYVRNEVRKWQTWVNRKDHLIFISLYMTMGCLQQNINSVLFGIITCVKLWQQHEVAWGNRWVLL